MMSARSTERKSAVSTAELRSKCAKIAAPAAKTSHNAPPAGPAARGLSKTSRKTPFRPTRQRNLKPNRGSWGKRKAEFPDAMALLSLEEWARRKDTKVLAVSSDGGWKAFAESSDHIIVVEDIAKVFGHFNHSANFIAQRIESLVQCGKIPDFEGQIKALIEEHFDDSSIEIEADSYLGFESEFAGVDVLAVKFMPGFQVVASDEETIDIALEFTCRIRFKAKFSWVVWDSADRDYVPMGSDIISREESDAFVEIVGKFSREFDDVPDILGLEGSVLPDVPKFGSVEPDWDDHQ